MFILLLAYRYGSFGVYSLLVAGAKLKSTLAQNFYGF